MTDTLTARIRTFLASGDNAAAHTAVNTALHDVLDMCDQIRNDRLRYVTTERDAATAVELAIARGLGIES